MSRLGFRIAALLVAAPAVAAAAAAAGVDPLFSDGFEWGDACAWSSRSPLYVEGFSLADGSPLPAPLAVVGGLQVADVQGGRARLRPTPSPIAPGRAVAPIPTGDVDARFTFALESVARQGVGFYVRQNGGYLGETVPPGEGYALFLEGFTGDSLIGIWRERLGIEEPLIRTPAPFDFVDGASYRARLRVNQTSPTETLIQARVWPVGDAEPALWHVTWVDALASLQNVSGGIALDAFTLAGGPGTPSGFLDDIVVDELCNPLAGRGPVTTLDDDFIFAEGPTWRDDHLLFTDIGTVGNPASATIWRYDPPSTFTPFRSPSNYANGLTLGIDGALLACEQGARRVSRTNGVGGVETLVGDFEGAALNSPNDLVVRSDGTLYFTDPTYGMPTHGEPREIAWNGLYRRTPAGVLTAEWQGHPTGNQPNGVALAPDERTLYVTDTAAGALLAWDVAASGALSGQRTVRAGFDIPDGMCVDRMGSLFVATWDRAVEVLDRNGISFGRIALATDATNCAFGGADGRTLYVTATDRLLAIDLAHPGLP